MANEKFHWEGREWNSTPKIRRLERKIDILTEQKKRFWELFMKRSKEIDQMRSKLLQAHGAEYKRQAKKKS